MGEFQASLLLPLIGFACGMIIGGTARATRFCTFGAIEDYVLAGRTERMRAWGLAIAVAILIVSALHTSGVVRIDQSIYLNTTMPIGGAIIGGLMFGFGMAMVGTCGYGVLVRLGGGDLKALVGVLVLGLSAYATARGVTAPVRVALANATTLEMTEFGGQGLPHLVGSALGVDAIDIWFPVGAVVAGLLLTWCFCNRAFRMSGRDVAAGTLIGLVIAAGFAATGIIGSDPFDPQPVESMTYVLPPGETIVYLLTYTGASIDFGITVVLGTIAGAFVVALWKSELRLEAFDGRREMRRHLLGALLMGFGGVFALGCTVGQGMTGMSTLSMSSPLALLSIFVGASFGIHYLVSEGVGDALASFLGLRSQA